MKSKTFLFGGVLMLMLVAITLSARVAPTSADYGFQPGEQLPKVEMQSREMKQQLSSLNPYDIATGNTIVVVWSADDATARLVNVWVGRHYAQSDSKIVSICIDATQKEAELLARLDNVAEDVLVLGLKGIDKKSHSNLEKVYKRNGMGKLFITQTGVIKQILPISEVWQHIQATV